MKQTAPIHLVILGVVTLATGPAFAQADESRATPPRSTPPSLDELLGLDEEPDGEEAKPAERVADEAAERELQRRLNEEKIGDAFAVAIRKMGVAADQLDQEFDTGLGTQRVQEEVLDKLAFLLDAARKQNASGSSSSSSQSQSREEQQKKPGEQRSQQAQGSPQAQGSESNERADAPPGEALRDLNTVLDESRTEWGNLPQRVREVLLQGRREKFSSLYEELTREYYRRLAEEGSS
ncbi:MAG: hypothetical protein GY715_09655 [Planctomycetes bacterium]|nr:hypothetical protein [Planctomycetota bacterium]